MLYNSSAVPSNVHLQFRPASLLTSKKTSKNTGKWEQTQL